MDVFVPDEHGGRRLADSPADGSDLAGFESWRTEVWGSPAVNSLGARYFPTLATGDLVVAPDEVPDFLDECELIRANLHAIAPADAIRKPHQWYVAQISARLSNVRDAALRAQRIGGGVIVW
ncbi:hypothetical protein ACGFIR_18245 [Micromonospora sp. NPDC049051]|uniref:hypothetical protein n=1 Tax=Micromonospora sp. NPDC049051 TaxID=3364264 RepID=UPI00371225B6